tara:strand:+ start:170 stop:469 length:300 start_codon:yes stop_codon:yes gene_type:complete
MTDEIENNNAEVNAAMMEILKDRELTAEERTQVFHNALDKLVGADKDKFQQQHNLIRAFMEEHERLHKETQKELIRDVADAVWELDKRKELENLNGDEK